MIAGSAPTASTATGTETVPALPDWAVEWLPGRCQCGAQLCRPACYCAGHIACSAAGVDVEMCTRPKKETR